MKLQETKREFGENALWVQSMSLPKSQEHEELEMAVNAVAADLADYTQLALDLNEAQQRIAQGDGQLKFAHVPLGMGCSVEGVVSVFWALSGVASTLRLNLHELGADRD